MKNTVLFDALTRDILENDVFLRSKQFTQHGNISIYAHSLSVARLSFSMAEGKKNIDVRCVVRAALLHDFFLYDWHKRIWSLHGWMHPVTAAENAKKYFAVSDREYSCIRSHMWPYTLFHPPVCREGWIVCMADKIIAVKETLFRWGKRHKLQDPGAILPETGKETAEGPFPGLG
ncbi:MAG: HD domain-containing protein [Spirochaetaceae bacterium]|jgi:uncharacterized protein|nr:HD domain-containing protein [Spirochaetaceae bacterium]